MQQSEITDLTLNAKVEGEELVLGDTKYILAPVPLVKMSEIGVLLAGGDPTKDPDYAKALNTALYYGLKRNHPEIEKDVIDNNVDMKNFQDVMKTFMRANGFIPKDQADAGETKASQ